jgi:hypothetical protein
MSAVAQAPVYAIHDGDVVRDRDTVLAIWHGNLGESERMRAKYDWFYLGASGDPSGSWRSSLSSGGSPDAPR